MGITHQIISTSAQRKAEERRFMAGRAEVIKQFATTAMTASNLANLLTSLSKVTL
jgi:hypothetical protein